MSEEGKQQQCPFCLDPGYYIDRFLRGRAKSVEVKVPTWRRQERFWNQNISKDVSGLVVAQAEQCGDSLRVPFFGDDFEPRWKDYTVKVYGVETLGEAFFPLAKNQTTLDLPAPFFYLQYKTQKHDPRLLYQQFFACRITHKLSNVELLVHWWPSHGRRLQVSSSLFPEETNGDIEILTTAMEFFRVEARGEPKFTEGDIAKAMQKLGDNATQSEVASELRVTARTLQRWASRNGLADWDAVKARYAGKDLIKM